MALFKDLKVGDKAPDFSLPNQDGNTITLSHFKGKKLILFFYPKDNTPTCTVEACNMRDNYQDLLKKGFEVLGISCDTEKKHQNFIAKQSLPYSLLADTEQKMVNAYGVWGLKKFMGREYDGIHRTTFVIDEQGKIAAIIEKVKAKEHTQQILESLSS